jgi:hypothetical protein
VPPLIEPSPPSNTLLITNLQDPEIFHPAQILTIRDLINDAAPIHTWSPLKSMRRIIVSFYSVEDALKLRQALDGQEILGYRTRIYFGESTPIEPVDNHLHAPESQKLFFISPPPSPPHGWEMKNEGPPNKEVHADDLATALAKLHAKNAGDPSGNAPDQGHGTPHITRARSGSSTMIYHPVDHGDSPNLPAIAVEDLTESQQFTALPAANSDGKVHTARPPVELMGET